MSTKPPVPSFDSDDMAQMRFLFQAVWEAAVDAMALSDPHGIVLAVNPAYCDLYGYRPDELVGQTFALIFPEAQRAEAEREYRHYFVDSLDPHGLETRVRAADGQERLVDVRYSFIQHDGRRVAMLSVIRDVAERARLQQSERDLQRDKDNVLLALSHDLKTPITAIKGQAQLLLRRLRTNAGSDPLDLGAGLRQIESAASRMAQMIDGLLDASSMQRGETLPIHRSSVDLVALIHEVVEGRDDASERDRTVIDAPPDLTGWWDEPGLRRVIDNLLSNAFKYSHDRGPVHVCVRTEGRGNDAEAILSVTDTGIGIPQHDIDRIFDSFYRGRNVGTDVPGSGIGLAGVRQIVELHGGTISVDSVEGKGSTFMVRLPVGTITKLA